MQKKLLLKLFLFLLIGISFSKEFFANTNFHNYGSNNANNKKVESGDKDFYELLGVDRMCTEEEIKQAYRTQAKTLHPDRGGDEEEYKKVVAAYDTLKDSKKRQIYDLYGSSDDQQSQTSAFTAEDILQSVFGSGVRFQSQFRMPTVYNLELSLEDFYVGKTVSFMYKNQKIDLQIPAGISSGARLQHSFKDQYGGVNNLIFVLNERQHANFTRVDNDLIIQLQISLKEALFGFERTLTHLDGTQFSIHNPVSNNQDANYEREIYNHNDVLCVNDLGMPLSNQQQYSISGKTKQFGKLYVKLQLEMPTRMWLSPNQQRQLRALLSDPTSGDDIDSFNDNETSGDEDEDESDRDTTPMFSVPTTTSSKSHTLVQSPPQSFTSRVAAVFKDAILRIIGKQHKNIVHNMNVTEIKKTLLSDDGDTTVQQKTKKVQNERLQSRRKHVNRRTNIKMNPKIKSYTAVKVDLSQYQQQPQQLRPESTGRRRSSFSFEGSDNDENGSDDFSNIFSSFFK